MSVTKRKGSTGGLEAPPSPNSANLLSFPRSSSPSGFQGFLTKSARWLSRTTSAPKPPPLVDVRQRQLGSTRRPTISSPSDPRPILGVPPAGLGASQSVLDLSTTRVLDRIDDYESPTPSDVGDLNFASARAWSRSVDDLSSFASPGPAPSASNPVFATSQNASTPDIAPPSRYQWDNYRKGSPSPGRAAAAAVPFPSRATTVPKIAPPITTAPPPPGSPHSPSMTHSPSSPTFTFRLTDATPAVDPPPNAHARSKSHGAHHPSNIIKPPTFIPPSPGKSRIQEPLVHRRKGSVEKDLGKSHGGAFSGLAGFPFHFGGGSSSSYKQQNPMGTPPSDAPDMRGSPRTERQTPAGGTPSISVEAAEPEPSSSTVRNSQIIHCTGFINRFAKPSKFNGQGLSSDKGWKPYKAQLIGTKLYFYKPPADRTAEIKDLFLTGPTPIEVMTKEPEAIAESDAAQQGNSRGRARDDGRRKRVYWGRARHAELVLSGAGEVVSGSADALIHEMVFATAFKLRPAVEAEAEPTEASQSAAASEEPAAGVDETKWKEFATAMLLFLPSYVDKSKFEAEVLRDLSSFERGGSGEEKAANAARLQWLLAEYLRLHGTAADERQWRALMIRPQTPETREISTTESSTSVPTITLSPSPAVPQSPTFANPPSPGRAGGRPPVERSASNDSFVRSKFATLLAEEGLSRDTLSRYEHRRMADSLAVFQRSQSLGESIPAAEFLAAGTPTDLVSAFSGSDDRPNWLTRLVVDMILGQVGKAEMRGDDGPDGSGNRTSSSTYIRATTVGRWIKVGDRCLSNGDECSWKAIAAALCCIAVVRLEKVWKRVEEQDRQTVEDWVKGEKKMGGEGISVWFGDFRRAMADAVEGARATGQADRFRIAPLVSATKRLQDSLRRWDACSAMRRSQKQHSSETTALVEFWGRCRADPSPRLASINQMLPLSFAIESRQRGQYQPYFWKPQPAHSAAQSILPLLFPEPLPTISLIDRNALIRTKKETLLGPVPGAEVNEAQVQKLTNPIPRSSKSRTPSRQRNIAEVDLDETLIPCFGGELILKLPRDDGKSRPTSFVDSLFPNASQPDGAKAPTRGNSIRLNTGSRLERKGSQMRLSRRSSLPSISQRNSLLIPDAPVVESSMRVTVKSGTLDRLVDVLVSGLDGVGVTHADDNGEMPLRDGKSKSFKVDRAEFARVWWTAFRSFVTPLVLFELLRKRFVGGRTTADPLALKRDASPSDNSTESPATTQLRLDVLSTLSYWLTVGGGAQDILDDLELYQSVQAFLNSDLPGCSHDVLAVRKSLLETFVSLTSLPVRDVPPPKESNGVEGQTHRFGSQPLPLDEVTPDELVSNLDAIAQTALRGVTEASMFELADLLETQTADRTGWFALRDGSSHDDTVVIQDLYLHLQNVEPSALIASGSQHEHLYRLMSPSLRSVIRAHDSLRDWLIFKLTNPAIPYSTRVKRMELVVQAVEACRSRSRDADSSSEVFDMDQPVVRSFVEATLVSAILSPESRAYARAWHDVAGNRNMSVEDLVSLVSVSRQTTTGKGPSLTVDPAWIMERMLEIITLPDVIEREESQSLINLEKRRFLHNLVVNTAGLGTRGASEAERQDMERLSNMAREAHQGTYDYRLVREAAQREMSHLSFNHGKRLVRPFYQLIGLQHEKTKRDRYLRDKLMKEKRSEQLRSDKRASLLNKAMQPNRTGTISQKHVRQKRSASGMYSLFRPLSVAFGATMERASSWEGPRRSAAELDFPALKPKADLTMNLVGAGVRSFINDQRPFTIQLDLEDGGRFLLQTVSGTECNKWLQGIKKVAETSALRRLTYLGRNAIPAYNEPGDLNAGPKDPNGIFGKDILSLLQRESPTGEYVPGAIPRVIEICLAEINKRGLQEPGLHRVAGSKSLCNQLRAEFNNGRIPDLTIDGNYPDIHVIGDCLRQWFRELPESVFTNHLYASFLEATKIPDYDERKSQLRGLIWQLPQPNFDTLRRLLEHLDMVVDNEEYNHMTPDSLAICFNVTLCKPPTLASFDNMQHTLSLVKHCILHYGYLFSELEPEFEENQEFDEVLLEEDEPEEEEAEDAKSSPGPESPSAQDGSPPDQRGLLGSSFEANMTQASFFTAPEPSPSPHSPSFDVPTAL